MGDPVGPAVPDGVSPAAARMRDYRNKHAVYAKAYARWQRQTREAAVAALIHQHEVEFEMILRTVRSRVKGPEKP